jgi:alkylation response protein AidB-like acyl-CoA dehydrogenase
MDFAYTDDQASLQGLAHEILSERAGHEHLKELEAASFSVFDRDLWHRLATAGLTGLAIPEVHGGAGLGFLELAALFEEVGRAVAPVPAVATLTTAYVLARGAPTLVDSHLAAVVAGDALLTVAFDETTEVTAGQTDAGWVLDGEKGFVPYGAEADLVVVPARTSDGATLLAAVHPGAPGLSCAELHTTNREPQALLGFSGVQVEPGCVMQDGQAVLADLVRHHTAALCMVAAGVCQAALVMTAKHTSEREQFGKKIASFQAVGQRAADAYVDAELVRLTALQAAWRLSEGWPAEDEIAVAKFWAGDGGMRALHACQHLHGGLGVDLDYPLHRYFLWGKQIEHELGTPTRQLLTLGARLAATPV